MRSLGFLVQIAGYTVFGIWVISGFLLCLAIVNRAAGFWGVVAAFALGPVTFAAAPWYAVVAWGNWFPFLVCYGGWIVGAVLVAVGSAIAGEDL